MQVAVLGAGGVGGYFGGRWADSGLDVTLIARGAHLQAIAANGLQVVSPLGDFRVEVVVTDDPAGIGVVDLVVVAVKTWQLTDAVAAMAPLVGPETVAVGLQNGVDAAEVIAAGIGRDPVLAGVCRIISHIDGPGVIRHVGAEPTILFGEPDGGMSSRVQRILDELQRGRGMTVRASQDIQTETWKKFHFLASTAGLGSVTQETVGVIRADPGHRRRLRAAMDEILDLARARGIELEPSLTDQALTFIDSLPEDGTSSMQRDFAAGRRTELESLSGAVVRLAAESGVEVPVHEHIYNNLLPRETEARRAYEERR